MKFNIETEIGRKCLNHSSISKRKL